MIRNLIGAIGLLAILGSLAFNAIQGTQIAIIGVGFILLAINIELQVANTYHKEQSALAHLEDE